MTVTIQNFIFTAEKEKQDLYFKGKNTYLPYEKQVVLGKKGSLTLDTYFNSLSIKKWRKFTSVKGVKCSFTLKGNVKVTLMEAEFINDRTFREKELRTYVYKSDFPRKYNIPVNAAANADIVFIKINCLNSESVFYGGEFYADISEDTYDPKNIAIGICTFRREDYVLKNLEQISRELFSSGSQCKDNFDVYVSDNGSTLDVDSLSNEHIKVFHNANLGGSGGFCRCMIEANFRKDARVKYDYMLLMDDDISFETETLLRLHAFLSLIKPEYSSAMVAFSMFPVETPCVQYTKGKIRENNTSKCLHGNLDLRFYKNVIANEKDNAKANFSGWWCHCIPTSYITPDNLAFPFFIRCDDTEYGCRYKNEIITLNGFGIWHPSFEGKHPISMKYYDMRNNLIFMTEGINRIDKDFLLRELYFSYRYALYLDYDKAMLAMKGVGDFLKGPDYLKQADFIRLNDEVRGSNRKETEPPEKEKTKLDFIPTKVRPAYSPEKLTLLAWLPAFRTKYINCDIRNVSLFNVRKVFCYNEQSGRGYYLTKSYSRFLKCRAEYRKLRKAIENGFAEAVTSWREQRRYLTSKDFWLEKLGLDKEDYTFGEKEIENEEYPLSELTDRKENFFIRQIKRIFPWYTAFGSYLRKNFMFAPHFTVRSDLGMHFEFWKRKLQKMFFLSGFNGQMKDIRKFRNIHKGERCFITCTGPSLTIGDLEALKDEYTFGVNSIIKAYPYTEWRPTYYVLIDAYAYGESLKREDVYGGKFCLRDAFMHYRVCPKYLHGNEHFIPINYANHWKHRMNRGKVRICEDISVGVYDCFTVTNMAIQIAAYMGFKDIYIIGADATYKLEKTHFIEGEWEKVHKKAQDDLALAVKRSIVAYIRDRDFYKKRGVNIYNATRGGMLEAFPRVNLDDIISEKKERGENRD